MSLIRIVENPEVEMEVSKLINHMIHLGQGYRQAQMVFLSEELNLPSVARLFELIDQLERKNIDELIRFQVNRGQKVTWFDVKPVEHLENTKPSEIFKVILDLEKDIHRVNLDYI